MANKAAVRKLYTTTAVPLAGVLYLAEEAAKAGDHLGAARDLLAALDELAPRLRRLREAVA